MSDIVRYKLTGFFGPLPIIPTFLIPYFVVQNSNKSFVQSVGPTYHIEGFAEYDIDDVPAENIYHLRRGGTFGVGDPAVVAVNLADVGQLWGTREEISEILRRETQNNDLPPFFRLEVSRFLGDVDEVQTAIALASKCFSSRFRRAAWVQLEQATSTKGAGLGRDGSLRANAEWSAVLEVLRAEVGEDAFRNWLQPMSLEHVGSGQAVIAAPTRFLRDWVATHYADRVLALWRAENEQIKRLLIVVGVPARPVNGNHFAGPDDEVEASSALPASTGPALPLEIGDDKAQLLALDHRFVFENFVVGKPNELAYTAARRVAEALVAPNFIALFNPLLFYGADGLGKTHLMHAIAWHVRRYAPERKIIYLSAEKFMYQFIRALRFNSTMDFKEQFRSVDLLMIDDVQFIIGKESTQEEFFHTFNSLLLSNRQIVISADKSPSDLEGMEERIRGRLGGGLVADLRPTTYELRLGILQSKAEQGGLRIPPKVMEFLAHKIASNVRDLEGALNRIAAHAQLVGRDITLESVQEVLHDLLRSHERRVSIDEIQKKVAEHFNIKLGEMTSDRRARAVARPRQVAMYLAKHLTTRSLPQIGRKFGGRAHSTVMEAVRKIEELMRTDPSLAEDVELLRRMLQG